MTASSDRPALLGLDLLQPGTPIALAVSGGGDSMALLQLMADWATLRQTPLHVFTVDHRLREESAAEAAFVAETCHALNLPHRTLHWDTPKPSQNAARQARHTLLAEAARSISARHLLLGHTLDDVAETHLMRTSRTPAPDKDIGPMPVSVSPVWPGGRDLLLLRPLILTRRHALRDWLTAHSLSWVDDPTNESDLYERPRIRKMLATDTHINKDALLRALQARARAEAPLAPILELCAGRCDHFGLIRVPVTIDRALLTDLISILIPVAAGSDRIPKAYARLKAMSDMLDPKASRYTIGGAWLQRADGDILIGRDPGTSELTCETAIFDGRFIEDAAYALPDQSPPFLVRHAIPPGHTGWRSLIPYRLRTHAAALEANARLLTRPRVESLS